MAKLLIIDDNITMVNFIQRQFVEINPHFTVDNTFCFVPGADSLRIISLEKLPESEPSHTVVFLRKDKEAMRQVLQFLGGHRDEKVLILIDVLLNSKDISAPSIEKYRAHQEFSCTLYAELLRIKNGKRVFGFRIDRNNFFHMLYSRSEASITVVAAELSRLYEKQPPEDKAYFPEKCCELKNISWCKNRYDQTDEYGNIDKEQYVSEPPLALPSGFREFFHTL